MLLIYSPLSPDAACILDAAAIAYIVAKLPPPAELLCTPTTGSIGGSTAGGFYVLLSGLNLGVMYFPAANSSDGDVAVTPPDYEAAASRLLILEAGEGAGYWDDAPVLQAQLPRATASEVYATPSPHIHVVKPSSAWPSPSTASGEQQKASWGSQLRGARERGGAPPLFARQLQGSSSISSTPLLSSTGTSTSTATGTKTASASATDTATDSATASLSRGASASSTLTLLPSTSNTASTTGTHVPSTSPTGSLTSTMSRTMTGTLTPTITGSPSATPSFTPTVTCTPSMTATVFVTRSTSPTKVGAKYVLPTPTPSTSPRIQSLTQFCGYNGVGPDCFWQPKVVLKTSSSTGGAFSTSSNDGSVPVIYLSRTMAIFKMPVFEGSVIAQMEYSSVVSLTSTSSLSLSAGSPTITAVHPVNFGDDPCFLVHALELDSAGSFESPYSRNASSVYASPGTPLPPEGDDDASALVASLNATSDAACLARSVLTNREFYTFLAQSEAYNASTACVRAAANVLIRITGTNFGRGITPMHVYIGAEADTAYSTQLECTRQYTSDTEIVCTVAALWPGASYLFVITPTGNASFPLAPQCPCGNVANYTAVTAASPLLGLGWSCVAQPTGSYTAGGLAPLIATQDYWKTNATEWMQIRFVNATSAGAPDFVKCPVPGVCLPGNECPVGSSSWMCTVCEDDWEHAYDSGCQYCTPTDMLNAHGLVALAVIVITLVITGLVYTKAPEVFMVYAPVGGTTPNAWTLSRAMRTIRRSNLMLAIPSFINYAQVLAAISNYGSVTRLPYAGTDPLIIPRILSGMHIFSDFGASLRVVQCAFHMPLKSQEYIFMALPVLVVLAPIPYVVLLYSLAAFIARVCKGARNGGPSFTVRLNKVVSATLFMMCWVSIFTFAPTFSDLANLGHCSTLAEGDYLIGNPEVSCADPAVIALQKATFVVGMFWLLLQPVLVVAIVVLLYMRTDSTNYDGDGSNSISRVMGLRPSESFFDTTTYGGNFEPLLGYAMFRARLLNGWSIVRTFFTCVLTALSLSYFSVTDPRSQNLLTLFVLLALWALHNTLQPYRKRLWNQVEAASILGQLAVSVSLP